MKTLIWTKGYIRGLEKPRCIFNGEFAFPLRCGDYISLNDELSLEIVESSSFNILDGSQEVKLSTGDLDNAYPTVDYKL